MRMRFLFLLLICATPLAQAEMWKCLDPDGQVRYTNLEKEAKGCTALSLEPLNTAPAVKVPPKSTGSANPANFPSVNSATQRQRDATRRKILEQELAQEEALLDVAKKQLDEQKDVRLGSEKNFARVEERLAPYQDRVRLHEANIASLKREIGNSK
jgi:hypothetical protein